MFLKNAGCGKPSQIINCFSKPGDAGWCMLPWSPGPMVYHCLSWQRLHSTSLTATNLKFRHPQTRHATRSASLWLLESGKPRLMVRSMLNVSTTETAPGLRLIRRSGDRWISTKFQRSKKLITRSRVYSSTFEASLNACLDFHRSISRRSHIV